MSMQYGAPPLADKCELTLIKSVDIENAATLFEMEDHLGAVGLRDHSLAFICDEFDQVSRTPAFQQLCSTHGKLVAEVLAER